MTDAGAGNGAGAAPETGRETGATPETGPDLAAYAAHHRLRHIRTHADVVTVSSDPARFCSGRGVLVTDLPRTPESGPPPTLLHADPPEHTRYRRLVQPAFAPGVVRALESAVRTRTAELLAAVPETFDAVDSLALPLPLAVIADLLGVDASPPALARFATWSDAAVPGATDWPEPERRRLMGECFGYLVGVATERRAAATPDLDPATAPDVITRLALTTTPDGERLSDAELAMFLIQLLVAGNETTRHAISGGLLALAERPDQWQRLRADRSLVPTAVEEILRWTAPVRHFLRTATGDAEVGGCPVAAGERLLLDYRAAGFDGGAAGGSGNPADRDGSLATFDVSRLDNPHLAFGFGPHFCLGAPLARLELRVVLEETLDRFAELTLAGPSSWNGSPVVHGLRSLPLRAVPPQGSPSSL